MQNNEVVLGVRRHSAVAKKVATIFAVTAAMMLAMCVGAFAAGEGQFATLTDGIKAGSYSVYEVVKVVTTCGAVLALGVGGISMLGGGQKGMENGKKAIIIAVCGFLLVRIAPLVVTTISTWIPESQIPNIFQ